MRRIILFLLIFVDILQAQQPHIFVSKYFDLNLPSNWHHTRTDTLDAFMHSVFFNSDSSELMEIYTIKIDRDVVLDNLVKVVTSEQKYFGDFGRLVETKKKQISNVNAVENIYNQISKRRKAIHTSALMFSKKNLGYVMVFRAFKDLKEVKSLPEIQQSFIIKIPRTGSDWAKIVLFMGICVFGIVYGMIKLIAWFKPLQWKAIYYCAAIVLISLVVLLVFYYAIDKIGYWIAAIISAGLIYGIVKIPKVEIVNSAFEKAKRDNTAHAYRTFCENHATAIRYCKQARSRMKELMDAVVKKYRELIATSDTPLTRAILAMFEYVKETDNFQVEIKYNNQNLVKDHAAIFIESKPAKLIPAYNSFTSEKNRGRENAITDAIRRAFKTITPEDVLGFVVAGSTKNKGINLSINYLIQNSGAFYYPTSEEKLPEDQRTWVTGVEFIWRIEIAIPQHKGVYSMEYQSKPAPYFTAKGGETDKIYDAMADSAFIDFCRVFIEKSGFKTSMMA